MKRKLKPWVIYSSIILSIGLGLFLMGYYEYQGLKAPQQTLKFNDLEISYAAATTHPSLLGGMIKVTKSFTSEHLVTYPSDQILNTLACEGMRQITVIDPNLNTLIFESTENLAFELNGLYQIEVMCTDPLGTDFIYKFNVEVLSTPLIGIRNLTPQQGDLLIIQITNLPKDSQISIEGHFKPSALLQTEHQARFYLPLAYKETAQVYPLIITINEQRFEYELDVQTYAFKEVHFTVASTVVSSTVGNNDAVLQYREVIYPTYETFETQEYWAGNFIEPLKDARISSSFGEMRYVNKATVPSRHAGIDYAIGCGTEVVASNAGKIEVAQFLTMIGNTIVIDHGLGLKTYYEHMQDLSVEAGEVVSQGQVIGHVGTTGYSTGCHLHFQGMVKNQSINPEALYHLAS